MIDDLAKIRAASRSLGLTPLAVETLIRAVREACNRAGRPIPVGAWLSAAILTHHQMEQEAP